MDNSELENQKKRLSKAERAESPQALTYKMVACLRALDSQIPVGAVLDGDKIRAYVETLEQRGLSIPGVPLSKLDEAETRAFKSDFAVKSVGVTLPFGKRAATAAASAKPTALKRELSDEELTARINRQFALGEQMLADDDPLLRITRVMNPAKRMKGTASPEDQALINKSRRLGRGI